MYGSGELLRQKQRVAPTLCRMSGLRSLITATGVVTVIGVGYGFWSIISPGEEKRKLMLKNLPESNPARMEETRQRNALVMQALKEAAETNDNLARGIGGSR
ncbi:ubiquinol-cytochrome-c reductase complex assembly factor 3 [Parambassis ranga]|uniref:Ubiquinol-cytochrome-c reductase complex assembly factor 3 n=1 Tax=Parambassis ranga TaxID=210632 RepID=A0A6P7IZT3_9TELE|nr:ubiquinol-cytochrome-c reductase complex assembly factor 3 [Parambassis ranga]